MKREIKFRAWHCQEDEMTSGLSLSEVSAYVHAHEMMQFTGLKDKNGVEIYEGDIVSTSIGDDSIQGVIKYEISEFGIEWTHDSSLLGCWGQRHGLRRLADNLLPEELEVIGNIYENPELLEAI